MNENDYLEVETLKSHCSSSINKLNEDINKLLETKEYLITLKERDLKGQYYTVWVAKIEDLFNLISVLVISITKDINDYETLSQILSSVPSIQTYDGERIYNNYIEAEKKRNEHNSNASNNMTKANKSIEPFKSLFLKWSGEESAKASQWQYVMDSEQQKMNEYDEIVQKTSGLFMNSQFPRQIAISSINNILDAGEYLNGLNMSLKWRLDIEEYLANENGEKFDGIIESELINEELYIKLITESEASDYYSQELVKVEINGKVYYYEKQSGPAWGKVHPETDYVSQKGCFLYASASMVSNLTGQPYTVEQMFIDSGAIINYDNGCFDMTQRGEIRNLNGSADNLRDIFRRAGVEATVKEYNYGLKLSVKEVKQGLAEGKQYMIWYIKTNGLAHWVNLSGLDENGDIVVLCSNGGTDRHCSINKDFSELKDSFDHIEFMYEISQ